MRPGNSESALPPRKLFNPAAAPAVDNKRSKPPKAARRPSRLSLGRVSSFTKSAAPDKQLSSRKSHGDSPEPARHSFTHRMLSWGSKKRPSEADAEAAEADAEVAKATAAAEVAIATAKAAADAAATAAAEEAQAAAAEAAAEAAEAAKAAEAAAASARAVEQQEAAYSEMLDSWRPLDPQWGSPARPQAGGAGGADGRLPLLRGHSVSESIDADLNPDLPAKPVSPTADMLRGPKASPKHSSKLPHESGKPWTKLLRARNLHDMQAMDMQAQRSRLLTDSPPASRRLGAPAPLSPCTPKAAGPPAGAAQFDSQFDWLDRMMEKGLASSAFNTPSSSMAPSRTASKANTPSLARRGAAGEAEPIEGAPAPLSLPEAFAPGAAAAPQIARSSPAAEPQAREATTPSGGGKSGGRSSAERAAWADRLARRARDTAEAAREQEAVAEEARSRAEEARAAVREGEERKQRLAAARAAREAQEAERAFRRATSASQREAEGAERRKVRASRESTRRAELRALGTPEGIALSALRASLSSPLFEGAADELKRHETILACILACEAVLARAGQQHEVAPTGDDAARASGASTPSVDLSVDMTESVVSSPSSSGRSPTPAEPAEPAADAEAAEASEAEQDAAQMRSLLRTIATETPAARSTLRAEACSALRSLAHPSFLGSLDLELLPRAIEGARAAGVTAAEIRVAQAVLQTAIEAEGRRKADQADEASRRAAAISSVTRILSRALGEPTPVDAADALPRAPSLPYSHLSAWQRDALAAAQAAAARDDAAVPPSRVPWLPGRSSPLRSRVAAGCAVAALAALVSSWLVGSQLASTAAAGEAGGGRLLDWYLWLAAPGGAREWWEGVPWCHGLA